VLGDGISHKPLGHESGSKTGKGWTKEGPLMLSAVAVLPLSSEEASVTTGAGVLTSSTGVSATTCSFSTSSLAKASGDETSSVAEFGGIEFSTISSSPGHR